MLQRYRHRTTRSFSLAMMAKMPGASLAVLAEKLEWFTKDGKPYKSLVQRLINALKEEKMIKKESGRWVLTKKGAAEAEKVELPLRYNPQQKCAVRFARATSVWFWDLRRWRTKRYG